MDYSTPGGETLRPRYRVNGFTTSYEGESRDFVLIDACLGRKLFYVELSPSKFRNSPSTTKQFYKYFEVAASSLDDLDDDLMHEFFDWALSPFYPLSQALHHGLGQSKRPQRHFKTSWTGKHTIANSELSTRSPDNATEEIMKYLKIAGLGADFLSCRLYAIVQDDNDPLLGLLYYYIDEESSLKLAVGPETPSSLKERWAAQITHTLMTLHKAGAVWGDVKAANVLVDKHKNAWIVDFGGGYTEGSVDREKAGTKREIYKAWQTL